jgi:signal transduction histidine kinase
MAFVQALWRPSRLTIAVIAALIVALPMLAVLQYRWLGQVSDAERERLRSTWRTAADRLARDVDRELARAFLHFQLASLTGGEAAAAAYGDRLSTWHATAPHPRLIRAAWHFTRSAEGPRSFAFTRDGRLEPVPWPAALASWRDRVAAELAQPALSLHSASPGLPTVIEDLPAIVVQLAQVQVPESGKVIARPTLAGLTILQLDAEFLSAELIPRLVRRHFESVLTEGQLAVFGGEHRDRVLYRSEPSVDPASLRAGDVEARLLAVRFGEFEELLRDEAVRLRVRPSLTARPRNLTLSFFRRTTQTPRGSGVAVVDGEEGRWVLAVTHRAGSLEAAVGRARSRNLAVSFGVLGVLAAAAALLVVSSERAQRLARQQLEFMAGVSHELRTPLAVIRSAGENLADGLVEDPAQVRRYGGLIEAEGRRLTEMVEQVLEFTGARSIGPSSRGPVDISGLIAELLEAWQPALRKDGFEVTTAIEPALPAVIGDEPAIGRSIHNLLSNAVKYSGDARVIAVGARSSAGPSGREVVITVSDRGPGVAAEDQPHIFEPFYRGRAAIAAQIHGTGLGLSLVKQIVDAHGGRVELQTTPGGGATFSLHLPAAPGAPAATTEHVGPSPAPHSMRA